MNVQDATTGEPAVRARVKVVEESDGKIRSGYTDLRGVFVCDDVHGRATVIVSQEGGEYVFHRGRTPLQVVAEAEGTKGKLEKADAGKAGAVDLFANVRGANDAWNDDNRVKLKQIQGSQKEQEEMGCRVEGWK